MTTPILITGGTGLLGRHLIPKITATGTMVRVLSRTQHEPGSDVEYVVGNVSTGEGLAAAVAGVDTVVHCAGSSKRDEQKARHLVEAARPAGVRHVVFISVVGADRIPVVSRVDRTLFGYFAGKHAAEHVVANSGIPWSTVRATQFHDLTLATVQAMTKMPVIPVPSGFRFQPIDTDEVATRLAELALDRPQGLVPDVGGPRIHPMSELIGRYLRAVDKHRLLLPTRMPGHAAEAIRGGANLAQDRAVGIRSWDDFLAEFASKIGLPTLSAEPVQ